MGVMRMVCVVCQLCLLETEWRMLWSSWRMRVVGSGRVGGGPVWTPPGPGKPTLTLRGWGGAMVVVVEMNVLMVVTEMVVVAVCLLQL